MDRVIAATTSNQALRQAVLSAIDQADYIGMRNRWSINYGTRSTPRNYRLVCEETATDGLLKMQAAGGRTVIELTVGGLEPRPKGLVKLACEAGVHVIMGCGYCVEEYQPNANRTRAADSFAAEIIDQIELGAWTTDVRAGIIGEISSAR
jgi:phosphotriesterase-related protein